MKTKKIFRQFICTTKIGNTETTTKVSAIVSTSCDKCFILKMESIKFRGGRVIIDNTSHHYYNTSIELKNQFEYYLHLFKKNNPFTTTIEITK